MTNEKRPGGSLDSSHLYEQKIGGDGKHLGTKDLNGKWYDFKEGEELVFERVEGISERVPVIKLADGTKLPFETWASKQKI